LLFWDKKIPSLRVASTCVTTSSKGLCVVTTTPCAFFLVETITHVDATQSIQILCRQVFGKTCFEAGFTLRCFQRLSIPHIATLRMLLAEQQVHQWCVQPGPLVLRSDPLNFPTPTADRDRTVSRRSKPSSRTTLIGEQPNPWDLLQPQDVMSRHRGAKRFRRYGLLGIISLLSPAYLLSVERWPFHLEPPDHYDLLSYLLDL
jgi:hypothetical protein